MVGSLPSAFTVPIIQDRDGGKLPLKASRVSAIPFVARVFADGGYAGRLVALGRIDKTHISA